MAEGGRGRGHLPGPSLELMYAGLSNCVRVCGCLCYQIRSIRKGGGEGGIQAESHLEFCS